MKTTNKRSDKSRVKRSPLKDLTVKKASAVKGGRVQFESGWPRKTDGSNG